MYLITRIKPWPVARFAGIMSLIVGLSPVAFYVLQNGFNRSYFYGADISLTNSFRETSFIWGAIMWIACSLSAFLVSALIVAIYNWLSPHIGYLKIDIDLKNE